VLFQRFNRFRDSLYDAEKIREVKEMETKYETGLKEQAIQDQKITIADKNFQKNVFLSLSILLVILIVVAIWFFNQKQRYLRKLKNEEIANVKKEQELKELNAMMHGQEEERNRIANDLHDRLGARLSSIKLLFQNVYSANGDGQQLVSYIDQAINETREISHNLSTDMLTRFGIQTALKDTIRSIQESEQIEADLVIYGMHERWPVDVERNIYYVLLELINNTIKHAKASSLIIQIHQSDHEVNVFYEDNGQGFDTTVITSSGLGLRSLSARVKAIKGDIVINSKPGHGLNVVITIDLNIIDQSSEKAIPSKIQ
jgi:signal transduction histidine kinase